MAYLSLTDEALPFAEWEIFLPSQRPKRYFKFEKSIDEAKIADYVEQCRTALGPHGTNVDQLFVNGFYSQNVLFYCGKLGALLMVRDESIDFTNCAFALYFDDEPNLVEDARFELVDPKIRETMCLPTEDILIRIAAITYGDNGPVIGFGWRIQDDMVLVSPHVKRLCNLLFSPDYDGHYFKVWIYRDTKARSISLTHPSVNYLIHEKSTVPFRSRPAPWRPFDGNPWTHAFGMVHNQYEPYFSSLKSNEYLEPSITGGIGWMSPAIVFRHEQFAGFNEAFSCVTAVHGTIHLDKPSLITQGPVIEKLQKLQRRFYSNGFYTRKEMRHSEILHRIEQALHGPLTEDIAYAIIPPTTLFGISTDIFELLPATVVVSGIILIAFIAGLLVGQTFIQM